jgi:hypothetical protein
VAAMAAMAAMADEKKFYSIETCLFSGMLDFKS